MKRISWQSRNRIDYVLDIVDGENEVTTLTPSAQPFVTQTDNSEDLFLPIRSQTGNIGILGEVADMEALLASSPEERLVTLTSYVHGTSQGTVWKGFLQTSAWSQDWDVGPNEISLPVVSYLGILESFTPQLMGYVSFGQFILSMATALGTSQYTDYVFSKLTAPLTTLRYRFSMENYRKWDADTGTWSTESYRVILEDVCKLFGWQCQEMGSVLVFLTADNPSQGCIKMTSTQMAALVGGNTPVYDDISLSTITEVIYGADHTISYQPGKKDIRVTGDVNPIDKTIWRLNLNDLAQGGTDSDHAARGGDMVYFYTRNFWNNDELSVTDENENIRFNGFDGGGDGSETVLDLQLQSGSYWGTTPNTVADSGWMHSRLLTIQAGSKLTLRNWVGSGTDVVVRIYSGGAVVEEYTAAQMTVNGTPVQRTIQNSGDLGLNYHAPYQVGSPRAEVQTGSTATEKGACVVSDRIYSVEQGGRVGATLKMDTGWKDHIIMSGSASTAQTALVTITPRVQYHSTGLTDGKIFMLKMNVQRVKNTQDDWEDFSGFLWLNFKVGSTSIGGGTVWVKDGHLRTYASTLNFIDSESGFAVACPSVSGQITIEIGFPAVQTDYWTSEDYNYYYSLSNITLEYTYDWRNYLWEDESANIQRIDIGSGFTESLNVDLHLTTQRGNQFGHGIILASDYSVVPTLYNGVTPEGALAGRMAQFYAESKKILTVLVNGGGSLLTPWLLHAPESGETGMACMAQSIDWRRDQITAYLYEY